MDWLFNITTAVKCLDCGEVGHGFYRTSRLAGGVQAPTLLPNGWFIRRERPVCGHCASNVIRVANPVPDEPRPEHIMRDIPNYSPAG